jgi:hypothetical protein
MGVTSSIERGRLTIQDFTANGAKKVTRGMLLKTACLMMAFKLNAAIESQPLSEADWPHFGSRHSINLL